VQNQQSPSKIRTGTEVGALIRFARSTARPRVHEAQADVLEQHGQRLGLSNDGQEVRVAAPPRDDVLVEVGAGKEATVASADFKQLVKDITLQIAAGHPFVVSREGVPADVLAKEKEIAAEQFKNKPPQAIAKIVEGKIEKFYQTYCLVDQGFVKKNSEISVKEHVATVAKQLGDEVTIRRFVRFQIGEAATA